MELINSERDHEQWAKGEKETEAPMAHSFESWQENSTSFINSYKNYLLSTTNLPSTILDARDMMRNRKSLPSHRWYSNKQAPKWHFWTPLFFSKSKPKLFPSKASQGREFCGLYTPATSSPSDLICCSPCQRRGTAGRRSNIPEELTRWKGPWCWEGLGSWGEGDDRGWDGWMASPTWWTWVWVNSESWWWTGRPGVLWFMGSQRVGQDWATELKTLINSLLRKLYQAKLIHFFGWYNLWIFPPVFNYFSYS